MWFSCRGNHTLVFSCAWVAQGVAHMGADCRWQDGVKLHHNLKIFLQKEWVPQINLYLCPRLSSDFLVFLQRWDKWILRKNNEVVWTFMKFKICLYFWGVFGPWRGSVASYTTDERSKNDQKERWRLNLEELKLQINLRQKSLDDFNILTIYW